MPLDPHVNARDIRWLILSMLHEARKTGKVESGGWLQLPVLRKLLDTHGRALTELELRDYCVYLSDKEIGCLEIQRSGQSAPYLYKYRITAKGVRAITYEQLVPGVGIYSDGGDNE